MSWQVTNNNQSKEECGWNRDEYFFFFLPVCNMRLCSEIVTGLGFVTQTIHYFLNFCLYNFLFHLNSVPQFKKSFLLLSASE